MTPDVILPALVAAAAGVLAWALVAVVRPEPMPPPLPPAGDTPPPPPPASPALWDWMRPAVGRASMARRTRRHYRIADRWADCLAVHCGDRDAAARWWVQNHRKRTRRPPAVAGVRAKGRG